jgi:energy-coupling factor transporter ATP-binding protein EcfA2
MKLERLRVRGFRCFEHETQLLVGGFTAVLGRNDIGKSALLEALQMFFDDAAPDAGDVNNSTEDRQVVIICEFADLPERLVLDASHPTTLAEEHLLNSDGRLEIHKVYDGRLKTPKLVGTYVMAEHPSHAGYENLLEHKHAGLKALADGFKVDLSGVPKNVSTALRRALWANAIETYGSLALKPTLLDVTKDGTKQVWAQLKEALPLFALFKADRASTDQDAEAQDPIKAAVVEALKAQEAKLDELREAVEKSVLEVAALTLDKLREIDPHLAQELKPTVARPNWASAFKIALTDESAVPVNKRGSGVRRLILLNFFRAQAERRNREAQGPGVIYAIEEPETSQHPHNQRLLLRAFLELSEQPGCQVLITTHNPAFARGLPVNSLRLLCRAEDGGRQLLVGTDDVYSRAAKDLGVLPDNSVRAFVGVEGTNDINFLKVISRTLAQVEVDIPDLEAAEESGSLIFIPLGGSNLANWIGRFTHLNRPEFHLFDRDTEPPAPPKYADEANRMLALGCWAEHTDAREMENYIHPAAINAQWPQLGWTPHNATTDVPMALTQMVVAAAGKDWAALAEKGRKEAVAGIKAKLNKQVVGLMTPAHLTESDPNGVIRGFLRRVGAALVA